MLPLLEVKDLVKRFGGLIAVNNVSFNVEKGQRLGIIGPNGAGKTTLFNLVTGHLKPDAGTIRFSGEDITGLKPHQIAKKGIARTFQIVRYFPNLTVYDHVLIGAISRNGVWTDRGKLEREVLAILEFLHMKSKKDTLVRNLTIPDKKRVELAAALALKPKLLLLDELMAGLNPSEIDEYVELLRKINEELGITIVIVEHVMRAIMKLCDRIVVLHHGHKIAEGSPAEIVKDRKVIEAYLGEGVAYA